MSKSNDPRKNKKRADDEDDADLRDREPTVKEINSSFINSDPGDEDSEEEINHRGEDDEWPTREEWDGK